MLRQRNSIPQNDNHWFLSQLANGLLRKVAIEPAHLEVDKLPKYKIYKSRLAIGVYSNVAGRIKQNGVTLRLKKRKIRDLEAG